MLSGSSEALREDAGWKAGGVPGGRGARKRHSGALGGGFGEAGVPAVPRASLSVNPDWTEKSHWEVAGDIRGKSECRDGGHG